MNDVKAKLWDRDQEPREDVAPTGRARRAITIGMNVALVG